MRPVDPEVYRLALDKIDRYRDALRLIVGLGGLTLLGGEDLEPGRAHQLGAHNAFEQAASIARNALEIESTANPQGNDK